MPLRFDSCTLITISIYTTCQCIKCLIILVLCILVAGGYDQYLSFCHVPKDICHYFNPLSIWCVLRGSSPLKFLWCHCRHRTISWLAHAMVCWRTAASHYLNQCWRIINCGWKTLTKEQFHKCSRYPFVKWFSWWRHQMETFSALLAICARNSPVPGEFPQTKASDAELWYLLWSAPE